MDKNDKLNYKKMTLELCYFEVSLKNIASNLKDLDKGFTPSLTETPMNVRENGLVFLENQTNAFFIESKISNFMAVYINDIVTIYKVNNFIYKQAKKWGLHSLSFYRVFGKSVLSTQMINKKKEAASNKMKSLSYVKKSLDNIKISKEEVEFIKETISSYSLKSIT